jgi:hypothetical protein
MFYTQYITNNVHAGQDSIDALSRHLEVVKRHEHEALVSRFVDSAIIHALMIPLGIAIGLAWKFCV